jgi:toxin ParE1/3/4
MKPARLRIAAWEDLASAYEYYEQASQHEGSNLILNRFIDAVAKAQTHIERNAGTGFPRYAEVMRMEGLRHWPIGKYPYSFFYIERADSIDVIRVLHLNSDIPKHLQT